MLARLAEEAVLHDTHSWEQLQRDGQEDGDGVCCQKQSLAEGLSASIRTEELNDLDKLVVLRQVHNHHSLDIRAVSHVSQSAKAGEKGRDDSHDSAQNLGELLGLTHGLGDRDDETDALESKHRCANEKGERLRVEHLDVCHTVLGEDSAFLDRKVDDWGESVLGDK